MEAFRSDYVYVRNQFAGILSETDSGYQFVYEKDYLASEEVAPVSLTVE